MVKTIRIMSVVDTIHNIVDTIPTTVHIFVISALFTLRSVSRQ